MATMIVRHKVADFNNWKKVFDEMDPIRASHGWISHDVLRDTTDSNFVTIVNRMKSVDGANGYRNSPELKSAMQHAGVIGQPDITIMEDAGSFTY